MVGCQTPPAPPTKFLMQAERLHEGALVGTVIADSDVNDYLQEIGDRLTAATRAVAPGKVNETFFASVRCHLVNCDTINAISPGGMHIYVTNGLFQNCRSEDELAAAMAHAYAHLAGLDLEATKMKPDDGAPLPLMVWNYATNRYTFDQERAADAFALQIYTSAGWDQKHFVSLFQHVSPPAPGSTALDRATPAVRAELLAEVEKNLPESPRKLPVADPKTFASLQQRAAQIHEPPGPLVGQIFLRAFPNCILSADTAIQKEAQQRLRPVPSEPVQRLEPN